MVPSIPNSKRCGSPKILITSTVRIHLLPPNSHALGQVNGTFRQRYTRTAYPPLENVGTIPSHHWSSIDISWMTVFGETTKTWLVRMILDWDISALISSKLLSGPYILLYRWWSSQCPFSTELQETNHLWRCISRGVDFLMRYCPFTLLYIDFYEVIAPSMGGLLIYAEHRYFGESMPFTVSENPWSKEHIGWYLIIFYLILTSLLIDAHILRCTPDQAMADYSILLTNVIRKIPGAESCPVFAFGGSSYFLFHTEWIHSSGSYGGLLTTWMRLKYPQVVQMGLAASAPFSFEGFLSLILISLTIRIRHFAPLFHFSSLKELRGLLSSSLLTFDKVGNCSRLREEDKRRLRSTYCTRRHCGWTKSVGKDV